MNKAKNLIADDFADLPNALQQALSQLSSRVNHAFVTGAGGFLGRKICHFLVAAGINVTGFARGKYPGLEQAGVNMVQGDISDLKALSQAMKGCDVVFHVAAKAGVWGSKQAYFSANVEGAKNIIESCHQHNIANLVYTSTPSVTFAGVDEAGVDESQPYAGSYLNYYAQSKALAEQLVLASSAITTADTANTTALKTVALRPHLIWGPNDPHLVPRVLDRAAAGRLKLVGKKDKLVDTIYVDNAAYAHILAALELTQAKPRCLGKAYYISNDEPITMAIMLNKILACRNLPPVSQRVPSSVAYVVGAMLEWLYLALGKKQEPVMTRFVAKQLSTAHYFDISAAKKELNYQPLFSIEQGMDRLRTSLS
ncbi:NAD-dependent epimerase/dehydratase family protein [Colwellia sp. D2M02]|uniref:2-alkyl-3-oxoalkanoate reductase n=1 Tax=Colwellia sp. D2M02 TaxID=2841562 RepID=UPI001C07F983|nr:2-alkyl-3-oxoalkanoate reductase [Colwellia sp. D2M02]MBU2892989.1 NAD-dependent epimerase/dehydratase family protein [Colwellia sp. D2M02]